MKKIYNEDMARNAAKGLFDDAVPEADDKGYVAGFDRPEPHARSDRPERADWPERPARSELPDADRPLSPDTATRSRVRIIDERSMREGAGGAAPDASAVRRERSMPAPRPAVKANPSAHAAPSRVGVQPRSQTSRGGESAEDEYSSFRVRSKPGDPIPSPRYPEPRGNLRTPRSMSEREMGPYEEAMPSNVMRYVVAVGSFVALIVLVVLVWRVVSLTSQLNEATAKLEDQNEISARLNTANIENEGLRNELDAAQKRIETLESRPAAIQPTEPGSSADNPTAPTRPAASEPTTEAASSGGGQTYTVVSGDSLSKIAARYYGVGSQANVDRIMQANNLTGTVISIGQELIIP